MLKTDPWSADLTLATGMAYAHQQDLKAFEYVKRFKQMVPNSPIAQRLEIK